MRPHVPGQGSTHLLFTQALLRSQSELVTHSGLQPVYGSPKYSGKQIQEPAPFLSLQIAFAPHGDGLQGVSGLWVTGAVKFEMKRRRNESKIEILTSYNN